MDKIKYDLRNKRVTQNTQGSEETLSGGSDNEIERSSVDLTALDLSDHAIRCEEVEIEDETHRIQTDETETNKGKDEGEQPLYLKQMMLLMQQTAEQNKQNFENLNKSLTQKIEHTAEQTKQDLKQKVEQTKEQINEKIEQQITSLTMQMEEQEKRQEQYYKEFQTQIQEVKSEFKQKIEEEVTKWDEKFEQERTQNEERREKEKKTIDEKLSSMKDQITEERKEDIDLLKDSLETTTKQLVAQECIDHHKELHQKIKGNTKEIEDLKKKNSGFRIGSEEVEWKAGNLPPIYITCGHQSINENTVPKFHGKSSNPMEYLKRLKQTYERNLLMHKNNQTKTEKDILQEIIDSSLEGSAANWWQLIQGDITKWEDFSTEFIEKFWSKDIQRHIRTKLETEYYKENGRLSRVEYFIERVLIMKQLTPKMNEEEIIDCMVEHFDSLIKDSKRVQNIHSIRQFESLLQREDIKRNPTNSRYTPRDVRRYEKNYRSTEGTTSNQQPYNRPTVNHQNTHQPQNSYNQYMNRRDATKPGTSNVYPTQQNQESRDKNNTYSNRTDYRNGPHRTPPHQNQQPISYPGYQRRDERGFNPNTQFQNRNMNTYPTREQKAVCQLMTEQTSPTTNFCQTQQAVPTQQESYNPVDQKPYLN